MAKPSSLTSALSALRQAESCLRASAAEASSAGDYDAVLSITHWAQTIRAMIATAADLHLPAGAHASVFAPGGFPSTPQEKSPPTGNTEQNEALRFLRDADYLVKVAQSRKTKTDYEHRAHFNVVKAIADILKDWRPNKSLITLEQLTSAPKLEGLAAYQIYVALGWLAQINLIRRHGRRGYSVPVPEKVSENLQHHWRLLPRE